jgi:hypothetical protein
VKRKLSNEDEFSIYVGLDWGTESHQACVLDSGGDVLRECKIDHSGQSITDFLQCLNEMAGGQPDRVAVAIEVPRGPVVEAFLEGRYAVYSINPKQLDRFRDRYTWPGRRTTAGTHTLPRTRFGRTSIAFGVSGPTIRTSFVFASFRGRRRTSAVTCAG